MIEKQRLAGWRRDQAIAALRRIGASLVPDESSSGREIIELVIMSKKFGDNEMQYVRAITTLQKVNVSKTAITDRGVSCFLDLPRLEALAVAETHVTDDGLTTIGQLTGLRNLDAHDNRFGDRGLAKIGNLQKLEKLDLHATEVSDLGVKDLAKLPRLSWLGLARTHVTRAGVDYLKSRLPQVQIDWAQDGVH
jgi:hypothetical protein